MRIAQHNQYGSIDIFYPQTKAEIVIESTNRKFVTTAQLEKISLAETTENKNKAYGYPGLDESGKININQIPKGAITQRFDAESEEEMLALNATIGDIVCRIDLDNTYVMLMGTNPKIAAAWVPVSGAGSGAVHSINGKIGNVILTKRDIGLENVANESKETMFTNPVFTGNVSVPTANEDSKDNTAASTEFVAKSIEASPKVIVNQSFPGMPKKDDLFLKIID